MSDEQPGGFTPLSPIGGPSLEQEEKALKSGRGRMMVGMIGAVVLAIALLGWFVMRQQPSEYGQIGRQLNGMRTDHFDAFWACALPRADLRDIDRAEQLIEAIDERASTNPRAYAQHVRGECMVRLDEHEAPFTQLIVPEDLRAPVEQLRTAVASLRTAWQALLAHLDTIEGAFDAEDPATAPLVTAVARGWHDYKVAHIEINRVIRGHLGE